MRAPASATPGRPGLGRATLRALLEMVYPPRCAACGALGREPFCLTCSGAVEPVPSGCGRCGLPGPDPLCGGCHARPPAFDAVRAGGLMGGPLADAVHALKYHGRPALARPLAAWLAARVSLPPGAALVSVPLAPRRRRQRGHDQAALLAEGLGRAAGVQRLTRALRRVRETAPQVGHDRAARARNVADAFAASSAVEGRDVVLVDDVVTTGATADACARALKAAGARSVLVVALARAE